MITKLPDIEDSVNFEDKKMIMNGILFRERMEDFIIMSGMSG